MGEGPFVLTVSRLNFSGCSLTRIFNAASLIFSALRYGKIQTETSDLIKNWRSGLQLLFFSPLKKKTPNQKRNPKDQKGNEGSQLGSLSVPLLLYIRRIKAGKASYLPSKRPISHTEKKDLEA